MHKSSFNRDGKFYSGYDSKHSSNSLKAYFQQQSIRMGNDPLHEMTTSGFKFVEDRTRLGTAQESYNADIDTNFLYNNTGNQYFSTAYTRGPFGEDFTDGTNIPALSREHSIKVEFDSSEEEKTEDGQNLKLSKQDFYSTWKSYADLSRNNMYDKEIPHQSYIKACVEQGIVPIPYWIKANKTKIHDISLNNISMGDNYAKAVSHLLPQIDSKFTLSLSNNRLTQKGADFILEKVNSHIQKIDMSFNPNVRVFNFEKFILNQNFMLREFSIEGNNVGDNFIIKLCEAIYSRPLMQCLNLAQNAITNK